MVSQSNKAATLLPGQYHKLGAHYDGEGVNFALFSAHAERVELCLFDKTGSHEIARYDMPEQTHDIWHGYLPAAQPGTTYAYRVYGPYNPHAGHRFNHHKLLLDPYARQLTGEFIWHDSQFAYIKGDAEEDLSFDTQDNADYMPKAVVSDPYLHGERRNRSKPNIPWDDAIIYELHVRGFTLHHPDVPELQRGSFAGLSHKNIIAYLNSLGVTTIELLPIHAFHDEHFLVEKGLSNYWGYNTLNFFAPHSAYLSGNSLSGNSAGQNNPGEFRQMIDTFHEAGIEVLLDVVYNHTSESNHLGPTVSFRGIDNASYYRLQAENPRYYINDTGCGNTLNINHPRVMQMVMDSLRYWAGDMGVDGFRFDLAAVMGREATGFNPNASFFQAVSQDTLLAQTKLIAEPWDIGPGGYQLGNFPASWSEWNDDYRDTVRRYWRKEAGHLPTFARRLHGSGDIFERNGRRPFASINYISSHDGFTLRDLVSYEQRHNEINGEHNNDGHRENLSENFGAEGETDKPDILAARHQQQRNLLATLLVSQGVPMLQAGDELGRSQQGNNNAYCQDNEISWIDWSQTDKELHGFVARLIQLRKDYPVLSHRNYIHPPVKASGENIQWLNSDGEPMREEHWQEHHNFLLGYLASSFGEDNSAVYLLVIFNNSQKAETFQLPSYQPVQRWKCLIDTQQLNGVPVVSEFEVGEQVQVAARSVSILASEK